MARCPQCEKTFHADPQCLYDCPFCGFREDAVPVTHTQSETYKQHLREAAELRERLGLNQTLRET